MRRLHHQNDEWLAGFIWGCKSGGTGNADEEWKKIVFFLSSQSYDKQRVSSLMTDFRGSLMLQMGSYVSWQKVNCKNNDQCFLLKILKWQTLSNGTMVLDLLSESVGKTLAISFNFIALWIKRLNYLQQAIFHWNRG